MRHLFIVDPVASLDVAADTTIAFMREAARRGQGVATVEIGELSVRQGRPRGRVHETELLDGDAPWYRQGAAREAFLDEFDVVWMRKDPPVDMEFLRVVQLLRLVAPPSIVINEPKGLLDIEEKLFTLRFPGLFPESLVSRDVDELLAFKDELGGEMILKPIGGCGGEGVFHLRKDDPNARSLADLATRQGREFQIGQRYLPEIRDGDKRIILIDGEPAGCVLRVPLAGEARANFHAGGRPDQVGLTERDREICAELAPALREAGILFAGIDVIGHFLTEVNVTSPTGIREINALDGVRLESQVLDAVEKRF